MSYKYHTHRAQIAKQGTDSIANLAKEIATKAAHTAHIYATREDALTAARKLPTLEEFLAVTPPVLCTGCSRYSLKAVA